MAFKMKRPVIKGTALHKKQIVAQTRTQADPSLTTAADILGRSNISKNIDYTIDPGKIKFIDKKKKKKGNKPKKREIIEATELSPRELESIQIDTPEAKLKRATASDDIANSKSTVDRFEKAAIEFGYDLSTVKGYKEAEAAMEYSDKQDKWINPRVAVGEVKKDTQQSEEEKRIAAEVAAKTAETMRIEKERQAEKKRIAEEKLTKQEKKKAELEAKNAKIREKNDLIRTFKEENPGTRVTQSALDAFQQQKINDQQIYEELSNLEEDSTLEEERLKEISYKPQVLPDETVSLEKPNPRDFNNSSDYMKARMDYFKSLENKQGETVAKKRDDKIWRNATKGGKIHENMRKSGYIPRNER